MRHNEQAGYGPEGNQQTAAGGMSHNAQYLLETCHGIHGINCSAGFVPEEGANPVLLTMKKFAC